jgi:hypothetical protein
MGTSREATGGHGNFLRDLEDTREWQMELLENLVLTMREDRDRDVDAVEVLDGEDTITYSPRRGNTIPYHTV